MTFSILLQSTPNTDIYFVTVHFVTFYIRVGLVLRSGSVRVGGQVIGHISRSYEVGVTKWELRSGSLFIAI